MKILPDLAGSAWRTSSYSDGGASNCVEVADSYPATVPVRDSKNPGGDVLLFPVEAWSAFISEVKADHRPYSSGS